MTLLVLIKTLLLNLPSLAIIFCRQLVVHFDNVVWSVCALFMNFMLVSFSS